MAVAIFGAAAAIAIAAAAIGSATAQGKAAAAAMDAIWRQPEAANDIRTSMMLALVFMEALTLFVFALIFVLNGTISGIALR
ncbi:MAG TPA: ATP synthase F0 subunit C [Bacillota bacterium]